MASRLLGTLLRRRSTLDDILSTLAANILTLASGIAVVAIAARVFSSDEAFSAYGNLRRINVALTPVFTLGLSMALTRYMPQAAKAGERGQRRLMWLCLGMVLLAVVLGSALLVGGAPLASQLLLGDAAHAALMAGLAALTAGTVAYTLVASFFTGRLKMLASNSIQLIAGGLVPLAAVILWGRYGVSAVMLGSGAGMALVALAFLVLGLADSVRAEQNESVAEVTAVPPARELLTYGLPRVPGFLAMAGMMALGPVLVTQLGGLASSLYMVVALQLLTTAAIPVKAMAAVFLPRFAQLKAEGRAEEASRAVQLLAAMMVDIGLFAAGQLAVFVPVLIPIWINRAEPEGLLVITLSALAIPGYLTYEVLRNPLDSHSLLPLNTFSLFGALAALIGLSLVLAKAGLDALLAVAIATVVAYTLLGALTRRMALKLLSTGTVAFDAWRAFYIGLGLTAMLTTVALPVSLWARGQQAVTACFTVAVYGMLALMVFMTVQLRTGSPWALELMRRVRARGRPGVAAVPSPPAKG